jgi:succinate dehydrogenase flavin-adding protein (antitoxin of CptAB toxin-antitoxin module)
MTPREMDELSPDEYDAFVRLMVREDREMKKAMANAKRRR